MNMNGIKRKIEYRLYPTTKQAQALQHRRMNFDILGTSITFADQCRALTRLRATRPEYAELNAQSGQVTLNRVDLAFQGFFRRLKAGVPKASTRPRDRFSAL